MESSGWAEGSDFHHLLRPVPAELLLPEPCSPVATVGTSASGSPVAAETSAVIAASSLVQLA